MTVLVRVMADPEQLTTSNINQVLGMISCLYEMSASMSTLYN